MKRLIVAILALYCVGADFAQEKAPELKFRGYFNTGIAWSDNNGSGAVDPIDSLVIFGSDSGTPSRINLNASYEAGDYGLAFRIRAGDDFSDASPDAFIRRAYGWQKFLGGKLKIQAGRLGDYSWSSANGMYNGFGHLDGPTGLQVQIKPVEGLNFGLFLPAKTEGAILEDAFASSTIGLNYEMKAAFDFQIGYSANSSAGKADLWLGGDLYAVKKFSLWFEAQLSDLGDISTARSYALVSARYRFGKFSAGAWLNAETFASDPSGAQLSAHPSLGYSLGDIFLSLGGWYGMKGGRSGASFDTSLSLSVSDKSSVGLGGSYAIGELAALKGEGKFGRRGRSFGGYIDFVYYF